MGEERTSPPDGYCTSIGYHGGSYLSREKFTHLAQIGGRAGTAQAISAQRFGGSGSAEARELCAPLRLFVLVAIIVGYSQAIKSVPVDRGA